MDVCIPDVSKPSVHSQSLQVLESSFISLISVVDLTLPLFLGRTSLWRLRSAVRADYRRFGFSGDDYEQQWLRLLGGIAVSISWVSAKDTQLTTTFLQRPPTPIVVATARGLVDKILVVVPCTVCQCPVAEDGAVRAPL